MNNKQIKIGDAVTVPIFWPGFTQKVTGIIVSIDRDNIVKVLCEKEHNETFEYELSLWKLEAYN